MRRRLIPAVTLAVILIGVAAILFLTPDTPAVGIRAAEPAGSAPWWRDFAALATAVAALTQTAYTLALWRRETRRGTP